MVLISIPLLLVFIALSFLLGVQPTHRVDKVRPIHIGLSIDDHSLKDLIILINSVVESAIEPNELVFHIVACGKDLMAAMVLKKSIATSMNQCLPQVKHELVAFMLPADSGFSLQLGHLKKKSNHWNSQSGADMVRFFMPSLFSHVERILYLDNDIIVSCCLEEVFDTPFEEHQIVGIALDSLNWATVTQFQRHYNATHPLVVKNMRRLPGHKPPPPPTEPSLDPHEVSTKEFSAALPRYPNDGVLLIDVQKYNQRKILETMNEIAQKNGEGEYVVNLGTQQFTVLALWDRWKELTPRANLRHFPDMARGYLMWFYYNGFLHYAGQHKPKQLCLTTTAENAQHRIPYLRVMSYTAWALSNYQVNLHCPADHLASVPECLPHVHKADSLLDLYSVLHRIIQVSPDSSLTYLHVGPLYGDFSVEAHRSSSVYNMPIYTGPTHNKTEIIGAAKAKTAGKKDKTSETRSSPEDLVETFFRTVLYNSTWSVRAYDFKVGRVDHSSGLLAKAGFALHDFAAAAAAKPAKKKGKKEPTPRTIAVQTKHLCASAVSPYKEGTTTTTTTTTTNATQASPASPASSDESAAAAPIIAKTPSCQSLLAEIKAEGRAHWDAQTIVVDVTPPSSFLSAPTSGGSGGSGASKTVAATLTASAPLTNGSSAGDSGISLSKYSSLGVLLNLDLVFMRPKIVLARLSASSARALRTDAATAVRFLRQNGFLTSQHSGSECGDSKTVRVPTSHATHAAPSVESAPILSADSAHAATAHFICVWGLRVNEFEFFPNLLT